MLLKFRFLSSENDDFVRDIEIQEEQTFYDLHKAIQDSVGFDSTQMASFFLTTIDWHKEQEITLVEMDDCETPKLTMEKTIIADVISKEKQKLLYVFDFFTERAFFVEVVEKKEEGLIIYPACVQSQGEAPEQIQEDN